MRVDDEVNGIKLRAYAGSTGVILAMDATPARRKGLLGFAIERVEPQGRRQWLTGMVHFPKSPAKPGEPVDSNKAPFQKFRWSDYRVYSGCSYTYTVHPVYGTWDRPDVQPGPTAAVTTHGAPG